MPSDTPPPSSASVSHPSPASSHDQSDHQQSRDHHREQQGAGSSRGQQEPDRSGTPGPGDSHQPHAAACPSSSSSSSSSSSNSSSSNSSSLSSLSLKRNLGPSEDPLPKPSPASSPLTMEHHLQQHKDRMAASQQQQQQHHASANATATGTSGGGQQFCLRWNNYQTNLTSVFDQLLQSESFVDVTLACDGQSIKAHKMVLSACSPYFQTLFFDNPCQHPIVIMRDVSWAELKAIVEFMYKGEINVSQDQIGPLLKVAEMLKIRGLADVNGDAEGGRAAPDREGAGSRGADLDLDREDTRAPVDHKLLNPLAIVHSSLLANGSVGGAAGGGGPSGGHGASGSSSTATSGSGSVSTPGAATKKPRSSRDRDSTKDHRLDARLSEFARDLSRESHISPRDINSVASSGGGGGGGGGAGGGGVGSGGSGGGGSGADDMEIKPGIAEMIREEERVSSFHTLSLCWYMAEYLMIMIVDGGFATAER
ncbi:protein bric-a-brac 2-like [Anopheles ziemanni]|uniref:protein bric-a-brac 2-like n=1 Tax=Anopheles coustani TaxID=139045 RepID=UPI002659D978|nr:protein bric-a-brac 2-like [Anopheles coustani]XP_058177962.1 protein bric-a-brac 2-like [Anopheles ziemanni]